MEKLKFVARPGFCLTELMVAIAIIAILASIAAPAYTALISRMKISTYTSQLHAAILLTRSEAIKRGRSVNICRSSTGQLAKPTCASVMSNPINNSGWGEGWLIYEDVNDDNDYTSEDTLIRVQGPLIQPFETGYILPVPNKNRLTFNSTGQIFGVFMRFVIARSNTDRNGVPDRVICIASGGRVRVDISTCSARQL